MWGAKPRPRTSPTLPPWGAPGEPLHLLSLPGSTPYGWIDGFAHGIVDGINACRAAECVIGGGDIGDSTEISVTVTAIGYTDRAVLALRRAPLVTLSPWRGVPPGPMPVCACCSTRSPCPPRHCCVPLPQVRMLSRRWARWVRRGKEAC